MGGLDPRWKTARGRPPTRRPVSTGVSPRQGPLQRRGRPVAPALLAERGTDRLIRDGACRKFSFERRSGWQQQKAGGPGNLGRGGALFPFGRGVGLVPFEQRDLVRGPHRTWAIRA